MCTSDHLMTPTIFITTQHDTQDNISKPSYTRRKYGVFPEIQHSASCAGNLLHMQEISCMCTSDHLMTPTIFITTQHDTQDNISKPSYTRRKYGVFPEIQHSASCAGNLLHMQEISCMCYFRSFNDTHNPIYFRQLHSKETIGSGAVLHVVY